VNSWCKLWNIKIEEGKPQAIYFSKKLRVPDGVLQLYGPDISFVNNVTYLRINFDRSITRRHHVERTAAKASRTYVKTYSRIRCERLSTNIKLTIYKALIRSVMTCVCTTWEYAADAHLLTQQRLWNRVLPVIGNINRCTLVRELQVASKLCRTQAEAILNNVNQNVCNTGQGEAKHRKYKTKLNSVAFSPQENYTDRAAAACRRS
jgi:hypothetical protein